MKIKMKLSFLKSLRFRVMVLLVIIGILPCIIAESVIVSSYENRAVELKKYQREKSMRYSGKTAYEGGIFKISPVRGY